MTTYLYSVAMDDIEFDAVRKALKHYSSLCEAKLSEGQRSPYLGHLLAIEGVLERLFADAQMMSTSSFSSPKRD